jgi:hypothetical protein
MTESQQWPVRPAATLRTLRLFKVILEVSPLSGKPRVGARRTIITMPDDPRTDATPSDWPNPDPRLVAKAHAAALAALEDTELAAQRLGRYYAPFGDYAGATFLTAAPNDTAEITAGDLFAVTLLNVRIRASAARRLLDDEQHRSALHRCLQAVPAEAELANAEWDTLRLACGLYEQVKRVLAKPEAARPDPWVTASKLCARKRPNLLPVRDTKVRALLGMGPSHGYRLQWLVYRELLRDVELMGLLGQATSGATTPGGALVTIIDPPLRIFDVALWMHAISLGLGRQA